MMECFLWLLRVTALRVEATLRWAHQATIENELARVDLRKMATGEYWEDLKRPGRIA